MLSSSAIMKSDHFCSVVTAEYCGVRKRIKLSCYS